MSPARTVTACVLKRWISSRVKRSYTFLSGPDGKHPLIRPQTSCTRQVLFIVCRLTVCRAKPKLDDPSEGVHGKTKLQGFLRSLQLKTLGLIRRLRTLIMSSMEMPTCSTI